MNYLTKQEIFTKVKNHLLTQNKKSLDTRSNVCLYRFKN